MPSELQKAELSPLPSDDELKQLLSAWREDCEEYHGELVKDAERAREYYLGNQTDLDGLANYESHAVENRVFLAQETAIPIVTARLPAIQATPPAYNEVAVDVANKTEKVIQWLFEEMDVQRRSETAIRSLFSNRFWVWHPYWDEVEKEIRVRQVPVKNCWFPRYGGQKLPYFIELMEFDAQGLIDQFGNDALDHADSQEGGVIKRVISFFTKKQPEKKGKYFVWAVWTEKWCAYIGKDKVFYKEKNPLWLTEGKDGTKAEGIEAQRKINYFNAPRIPYIIGTAYEDGEETVGITSSTAQSIAPQDTINKVLRYFEDYMETVGDPQYLIDSSVMSREEADNITAEHGRKIIGKGVANENLFRRTTPPQMPQYIERVLIHAQSSFDNIFGAHSSTRGERSGAPTATQDQLMKESDFGRLDIFSRILARALTDLASWCLQFIVIYYDEKRDIPVLDDTGEVTFIQGFNSEMVQKGLKVRVKPGTSLPDDKVSRANLFLQLAKLNLIRPADLFKNLDLDDPRGMEMNLLQWMQQQAMPPAPPGVVGQPPPQEPGGVPA